MYVCVCVCMWLLYDNWRFMCVYNYFQSVNIFWVLVVFLSIDLYLFFFPSAMTGVWRRYYLPTIIYLHDVSEKCFGSISPLGAMNTFHFYVLMFIVSRTMLRGGGEICMCVPGATILRLLFIIRYFINS